MAKRGGKTKVKAMSTAAIAARKDDRARAEINAVAAAVGLPEAQRGHHAATIVPTRMDGGTRPIENTIRKLTRVDRLFRSNAIKEHHVAAIDLYVAANEAAYGACVRVGSYGDGGGGSSPTGAAAAAHGRQLDRIGDAWRYDRARRAIPRPYVAAFERIVLDNHPIGAVGADIWPSSSAATVSGAIRDLVRTCADALCVEFEHELGVTTPRTELMKTMQRFDAAVRAQQPERSLRPISDAVEAALWGAADDDALFAAPDVIAAICRENGVLEWPGRWAGHLVVEVAHWQFGWMVQPRATAGPR